jgi:hypothetical protein
MIERLRRPGGRLGTWTVVCALGIGLIGALLSAALLVRLVTGGTFWSDTDGDVVIGIVFGLLGVVGAIGFVVQDRMPWPGAALAILGGLGIGLVLFWALLPLVLGLAAVVVAVMRARALTSAPAA